MPNLIVSDSARGWMLMRDGGEQLRASIVKALQWRQSITRMEGSVREEYAWIVPESESRSSQKIKD